MSLFAAKSRPLLTSRPKTALKTPVAMETILVSTGQSSASLKVIEVCLKSLEVDRGKERKSVAKNHVTLMSSTYSIRAHAKVLHEDVSNYSSQSRRL